LRGIDFSSWHSLLATLIGLALVTLIGMGIRLVMMVTIQQRRERLNRQINERLRVLIAVYKVLGGSFTGDLAVDPRHLRDLRRAADDAAQDQSGTTPAAAPDSERPRRIRDAVEAALSDIILLGTQEQVHLAAQAARDLADGQPVHTHALVVSLRDFIRKALDLDPISEEIVLPPQGPARPGNAGGRGKSEGGARSGGGGGSGGGMAGGMGAGMGQSGEIEPPDSHAGR